MHEKQHRRNWWGRRVGTGQVLEDTSDTWSHDVRSFDQTIGWFGAAKITVVDNGPLQASVLIERAYEGNRWLQQIIIRQGLPELLIRNWLTWQGQWRMLKLAFDVATARRKLRTISLSAGVHARVTAAKCQRICGWT